MKWGTQKLLVPLMSLAMAYALLWPISAHASSEDQLKSALRKTGGYVTRKLLRSFRTAPKAKKNKLVDFYKIHGNDAKILVRAPLRFQTGPYKTIALTDQVFRTKCLDEILWSAGELQKAFPNISFQIDGQVSNCKNLKAGVQNILSQKSRVKRNISRFNSPMHTVYLTNKTKFNHDLIGKMGLYIDVNRSKEIEKRLVEFRVGRNDITHEKSKVN